MDYANDFDWEETPAVVKEIFPEIQDTLETVNVYELSSGLFFYGGIDRFDIVKYLQPHTVDICITIDGTKENLQLLYQILSFKSTILIYDTDNTFDQKAQEYLEKKAYELTSTGNIGAVTVYEFTKLNSDSYISLLNSAFSVDIISLLFVSKLGFDDVVYCDATDLLDIQFYSLKKGRSVVMPIPLEEAPYVLNYLENKDKGTDTNFNENQQYELEF